MRCWNHKVENFYKDLKKTFYKSRVWLGTERPSTFTFHPRLIFILRSHNSMPIRCWHKVRNFYKETGKLSKRLFDLRWSFLTTFTKVRIHNMWQECKNVAKIFQREGGGGVTLCQTNETHQIVKSTSMPYLLGKILISKTYHELLWTKRTGFQLCPNGKKMCDKKMCGVMGTQGCCSEKQSGKLRKFKAHSHLPPHCPPTWKYTNHFSLMTSGLN